MHVGPAIVVLAAGRGARFRGFEHKLKQGLGASTVLGSTLAHALATGLPVQVVTTETLAELVRLHVATRNMVVLSAASALLPGYGMGDSIAAGVAACGSSSGWLILPADMPLVQSHTLLAVARELSRYPIAYAQYQGRRGHPVGFSAELYSELVMLTGDEGARRLLARYPSQAVEANDPGVLLDLDTEADLARIRSVQEALQLPLKAPMVS